MTPAELPAVTELVADPIWRSAISTLFICWLSGLASRMVWRLLQYVFHRASS